MAALIVVAIVVTPAVLYLALIAGGGIHRGER